MTLLADLAESAYRRAAAHWQRCSMCREAGGEWAELAALCPKGRALTMAWAALEAKVEEEEAE